MFVLALVPNWKVGNQHGVGRSFPTFHPPHARSQLSSWERERWLELGSQLESWEPEGGGWGWVPNWKVGNQHGKILFSYSARQKKLSYTKK